MLVSRAVRWSDEVRYIKWKRPAPRETNCDGRRPRPLSGRGDDEGAYGKEYASEGDAEALRNDKDNDWSHRGGAADRER